MTRPSPSSAASADQASARRMLSSSWLSTDITSGEIAVAEPGKPIRATTRSLNHVACRRRSSVASPAASSLAAAYSRTVSSIQ
jgi:hypothetical protein